MKDIVSIRLNHEFKRVYGRGRSMVHPLLVTYCLKNRRGVTRVGITTGKKIGCAVRRNRARRVLREAWRQLEDRARRLIREALRTQNTPLPPGYDLIFVARVKTTKSTMPQVAAVMKEQLSRLFCEKG